MSDSGKRNLPSWMSSRDDADKPQRNSGGDTDTSTAHHRDRDKPKAGPHNAFAKLLDGVVIVLSGFVNPERGTLRSQAQEMGAQYQADWTSNCTLLICAFPNTPKFRQVEADKGTIVSKEWILECYSQKKLVAIEPYLMHAGKPWRKSSISGEAFQDDVPTPAKKQYKQVEGSPSKPSVSGSKGGTPKSKKESFSPAEVKRWAIDDLNDTVSWLESQEERPEPTEVKKIAAEGILTCLQDAIESLEKNQDIARATEQWNFIPRVVKELTKLEESNSSKRLVADKSIYEQALTCKQIYQKEFDGLDDNSTVKKSSGSGRDNKDTGKNNVESKDASYDSDETIEMTEDEIDLAYESLSSKLRKW